MSNIEYTPGHWTTDSVLFTTHGKKQGLLAVREGKMFGAQSAYALLGPDLAMTGGRTNNPPNATGPCWDNTWSVGVPAAYFTQDGNNTWVERI